MKRVQFVLVGCVFVALMGCENNTCPEETTAIRDAQGNVIDCFDPVNGKEQAEE